MISSCVNPSCDNIFQHPKVQDKIFCSEYCRFTGLKKNLRKSKKVKALEQTLIDATIISNTLKRQLEKRNTTKEE